MSRKQYERAPDLVAVSDSKQGRGVAWPPRTKALIERKQALGVAM